MKLFVKILIVASAVLVGLLGYCLWVFFELSQDLKNSIKTQPMRDARWKKKDTPIDPSQTIQLQSGGDSVVDTPNNEVEQKNIL